MFITGLNGLDLSSPASDLPLRGHGKGSWFGWADDPKLEELRGAWFAASDPAAQQTIGAQRQQEAFNFVPYSPLGFAYMLAGFRKTITGMLDGFVIFRNVRRA